MFLCRKCLKCDLVVTDVPKLWNFPHFHVCLKRWFTLASLTYSCISDQLVAAVDETI